MLSYRGGGGVALPLARCPSRRQQQSQQTPLVDSEAVATAVMEAEEALAGRRRWWQSRAAAAHFGSDGEARAEAVVAELLFRRPHRLRRRGSRSADAHVGGGRVSGPCRGGGVQVGVAPPPSPLSPMVVAAATFGFLSPAKLLNATIANILAIDNVGLC